MVNHNLKQKEDFKKDVSQIVAETNLIRDISSYNIEDDVVSKKPIYQMMDREAASKLFK